MIRSNLRLVVSIAKRYANRGLTFLDLVEEGNLGLMTAVARFDPERNVKFGTYATWWIKQAIRKALTNTSKTVRIPTHMVELITKWKTASLRLSQKLGRKPYPSEVAKKLKLEPDAVEIIRRAINTSYSGSQPLSLDLLWKAVEDSPDEPAVTEEYTEDRSWLIRHYLESVEPREADVLKLRYGLGGDDPLTLREVGLKMSITRERVRQIEKAALNKIQAALKKERMKEEGIEL